MGLPNNANPRTLCAWARTISVPNSNNRCRLHAYGSGSVVLFSIRGLTTPYAKVVQEGGSGPSLDEANQFPNATWVHLCVVVVSTPGAIIYNNGAISGMGGGWTNTVLANTASGYGMGSESGATSCQIEIDDSKIYARALSAAEILAMSKQ
ncbi:MAG: LamG-like jellyroll fold domain-containing protein [Leptospiraceae bacterium]|nr:LamG-like jellyroll fold domain-containing protein [Leptospiraceae bacterium]